MSKENLGSGVREIVELLEKGTTTIDLHDAKPGDRLLIKIGEKEEDHLDFEIIEPATNTTAEVTKSARAWLPGWKFHPKLKNKKRVKILIGGSCTYNPGAPYGMSMLTVGRLTLNRSMVIWCEGQKEFENSAVIFRSGIKAMVLIHED